MTIRGYSNSAPPQALTSDINSSATVLPVGSNAGYPSVPFVLGLERGTSNQEVVLCTALSGGTGFVVTRGYDGTTAISHLLGATVEHTSAAVDYREANAFTNLLTTVGDVLVFGNSGATRQPVGADGQFLVADSTQPSGLNWVQPVPAGTTAHFAGSSAPAGWFVRNGAVISRTTYSALFSAIGTAWGVGDGSTTFSIPNALNHFDFGAMGGIGAWGGSESVVLELANIPQHSHWLEGPDGSANIWTDNTTGTGLSIGGSGHFEEVAADSFYTSSVGTGESFSVMPPYGTYLPIIKY